MAQKVIKVGSIAFGNHLPLRLIGGPCVIESEKLVLSVAQSLKNLTKKRRMSYVFKSSYDKANRTSVKSFRGPGAGPGLDILARVKEKLNISILTDVHSPQEAQEAGWVADVLQIPAFLSRQTDLLLAAGETGRVVNIKKGQFMSPWDMENAIKKVESTGNKKILLTERGASFGYNNLVVDMRGLEIMKSFGYPVIFDATHSVQLPGGKGSSSGGQSEYILPLARAAVGVGVAGVFMEIHPNPARALSDGSNSVPLRLVDKYLKILWELDKISKRWN
jgi:2-dehydro-3-deoxyphosphooctonate aldolase (KDO 8-P synthase)